MDNNKAKKIVKAVFSAIKNAKSVAEIFSLLDSEPVLIRSKINTSKYPRIHFDITQREIEGLVKSKYLSSDYKLAISMESLKKESAFTKLLYSILWKNGDLGKEKHIIDGVLGSTKEDHSGLVFYHFGKYLGDPNKRQPIVDQHTLRAYGIYLCVENLIDRINSEISKKRKNSKKLDIEYYRKLSVTSKKEIYLINDYKAWIEQHHLYRHDDFVYVLDLVLFALGKAVKKVKEGGKND